MSQFLLRDGLWCGPDLTHYSSIKVLITNSCNVHLVKYILVIEQHLKGGKNWDPKKPISSVDRCAAAWSSSNVATNLILYWFLQKRIY